MSSTYTDIPIEKITHIITITNNKYIDMSSTKDSMELTNILGQNYFQFYNKVYKQKEGLAIGAPTTAVLSEIDLQYIQHICICKILQNNHISSYYRYVDDIVIVQNTIKRNVTPYTTCIIFTTNYNSQWN
jgi:hypothetical protein